MRANALLDGADPNAPMDPAKARNQCASGRRRRYGDTPLHSAAFAGHTVAINALLDGGADPKARNKDDKTPFDLISYRFRLVGTRAYRRLRKAR